MQILVISDLHRRRSYFEKVLEKYPNINTVFFLGDGVDAAEEISSFYPQKNFHLLAGNCDFLSRYPSSGFFNLNGVKILATHGHTYGVKGGTERLFTVAKNEGVSLALYGHTHVQREEYRDGVHIVCPGALDNYAEKPGYAIIDVTEKGIVVNLLRL